MSRPTIEPPRPRRPLLAAVLIAALAGCLVDDPELAAVDQADTAAGESPFQQAGDWLGALSGYYTTAVTVVDFANSFSNEEPPEREMLRVLHALYDLSLDIQTMQVAIGDTVTRTPLENAVSAVGTQSELARIDVAARGYVTTTAAEGYRRDALTALNSIADNPLYWSRLHAEQITFGEWRTVTAFRQSTTPGARVWEYRWGLPALMAAVAMYVNVIVATDAPALAGTAYDVTLGRHRALLAGVKAEIESKLACGYSIAFDYGAWGSYGQGVTYHVHAICGDPYTGREVVTVIDVEDLRPWDFDLSLYDWASFDVFAGDDWTFWTWGGGWGPGVRSVGELRNRFWSQLGEQPSVATAMTDALDRNYAQLRREIGLFDVQRTIDFLATIIARDPGPLSYDRLRSEVPDICLSHRMWWWVDYAMTATCDPPLGHSFGQAWWYDARSARLIDQDTGSCLSVLGSTPYRAAQPVIVEYCDATNDAQRWSYDPVSRRVRNAAGMTLDITNGNTAPGAGVWTWWENGSYAQRWGFRSPWTTTGTGGPHL